MNKQFFLAAMAASVILFFTQKVYPQGAAATLTKAHKKELVASLLQKLNEDYIFPDVAKKAETVIKEHHKKGAYDKIVDPNEMAKLLTEQLRETVKDKHLSVWHNPNPRPAPGDKKADSDFEARFMRHMRRQNLGLPKIDILEGNVGYLKIVGFGPVDKVGETCTGAMMFLANTEALIIDLRDNHGGEPELVQYIVSYFFGEEPVHINDLYYRKGNKTTEYWTIPVKGSKYLDRPVYVLTSNGTFSAGEEFAYDMQTQKRATLVGEVTGGGANPGDEVALGNGFYVFIPTGRAINPITKTNWEGVGVKPDVQVPAPDALKMAHTLALEKLLQTAPDDMSKDFYKRNLEAIARK